MYTRAPPTLSFSRRGECQLTLCARPGIGVISIHESEPRFSVKGRSRRCAHTLAGGKTGATWRMKEERGEIRLHFSPLDLHVDIDWGRLDAFTFATDTVQGLHRFNAHHNQPRVTVDVHNL